jgi:hypothetical protein
MVVVGFAFTHCLLDLRWRAGDGGGSSSERMKQWAELVLVFC